MRKKVLWITETGVMLALLIALQWVTSFVPKPLGQLITGSCVNAVLAMTVLVSGLSSGLTVALLSPIFAFLLNIAPNVVVVPAIMVGNATFVAVLRLWYSRKVWKQIVGWIMGAAAKFAVLYALVVWVICGVAADALLQQGILKKPMLNVLPATFSWSQLITALIGGGIALLIAPIIARALKKPITKEG